MFKHNPTAAAIFFTSIAISAIAGETTVVDFSNGDGGWSGPTGPGGYTEIDHEDGNPLPSMRTVFNDFGITFLNDTNPAWVRSYAGLGPVTFSIDTRVINISFFDSPVTRPWLIELRDFDTAQGGFPWAGVWFKFADISAQQYPDWTTFSVTIENPDSETLPDGWRGFGAEDPVTFEPILPPGVTFADILAGVDQVVYTTLEPGFFFGFTDHEIAIDNITVTTQSLGCNPADIAEPFGVLDLADIQAFVNAFIAHDPAADIAPPEGVFDLADLSAFIQAFTAGCP